ncbi:RDD family protein [Marisediminicola antarctica]|uniref:Transporter n=1 Tax=Marisediminicola antarctica TaxID=674079 RepID=A0A7L5AH75_9MICO|nr:RDD family protein [Marisediminicola antarctica]QHO69920.1 transporter [Marisediminicola antarctica]
MPGSTPSSSRADGIGQEWPGKRLGLPASGPRSIARLGRRIAALFIDWAIAYALAWLLFRGDDGIVEAIYITGVFVVLQIVMITFAAGGIGHLLLGMRVVPLSGGVVGIWRPAVRTVLLALVIPAVVFDRDQRGLHDQLAGTVLVRI